MRQATTDTRERALAAYAQGGKTQPEIAALFGITVRTFQRWWHTWRHEQRSAPKPRPGRGHILTGSLAKRLRKLVAKQPDATLQELAEQMGHVVSYVTVYRRLEQWELSLKKRRSGPQSKTDRT